MDKHARKSLHELASRFKIKSQSTGDGDQRRPVLYRTKRTAVYSHMTEATRDVDREARKIHRKYFHRMDVKGERGMRGNDSGPRENRGGAGGGFKALVLREGEIVGASAPQLGKDNKGHAMLEKMGWSKGMALGTIENKGIMEPVAQVIKRSKAGLG